MKTTKRALFSSVIALILCFSMLVGTTFAWFTDSVESGENQIIAGNLDVEVYYGDPAAKNSIQGVSELFHNVDGKPILWEPGAVAYEKLTVANLGTLALKYQLSVNFTNATETPAGKTLADVLQVAVVKAEELTGRDAALTAAKAAENKSLLKDFVLSGELDATNHTNDTYGIVIWWEPSNSDNDFNMNNENKGTKLSIDLGIKLVATQLDAEFDSFGNDYDEDAWHPDMTVYTGADLQAALATGGNVSVVADIELSEPLTATADTNINLNGHTLSSDGEVLNVTDGAEVVIANGVINAAVDDGNALTVTNTTAGTTSTVDLINVEVNLADVGDANSNNIVVSAEEGNAVLNIGEGTVINAAGEWVAAIKAEKNAELNITGGVINVENTSGDGVFGISVEDSSAVVNVTGGVFNITGNHSASGIVTWGDAPTVNISGGVFNVETTGGYGIAVEVYAGQVNATGGVFNINATGGAGAYAFAEGSSLDLNVGSGVTINVLDGYKNTAYESGNVNPNADCAAKINDIYAVTNSDELVAAINAAADGDTIVLAAGDYALRFTNDTNFNVDNLTIVGMDGANLSVSSSEVGYDRIQGDNVTFENINFTGTKVGATGKATYNDCTFAGRLECASSGSAETYANNCTMNDVHTDGDMTAGNAYFTNCTMAVAEYAKPKNDITMTFTDCTIGELIPWNVNTTLNNCTVTTMDLSGVTTAVIMVDGVRTVGSSEALKAAIDNGAKEILLAKGNYVMTNTAVGVTLKGVDKEKVVLNNSKEHAGNASMKGAINTRMNFENLTFENTVFTMNGTGSVETGGGMSTFTNVHFAAGFRQGYGTGVVFTDCSFGKNDEGYALHFQSVENDCTDAIQLNGCKFLGGKVHLGKGRTYQFTNCDFAAGTDFQIFRTTGNLTNCTVDGVAITAANIKTFFPDMILANVTLDGACVVATSESLDAAVKTGATIYLLPGEYELNEAAIGVTLKGVDEETVRVNAVVPIYSRTGSIYVRMHFENLTLTNTISTFQDTAKAEDGGVSSTFTNVTFEAGFRHGYGSNVVFTDCTFGSNSEGYALHFEYDEAGTAGEIKLTGCEFKGGKVHLGGPRTYAFTNCDFAAGTDFQVWAGVTLVGCTVDGVAITADNIATLFPALDTSYVTIK